MLDQMTDDRVLEIADRTLSSQPAGLAFAGRGAARRMRKLGRGGCRGKLPRARR